MTLADKLSRFKQRVDLCSVYTLDTVNLCYSMPNPTLTESWHVFVIVHEWNQNRQLH